MFLICERNEGEWKSEVVLWFCSQLNVVPTTLIGLFLFPLIIMWSKLFNFSLINYHLVVKEIGMLQSTPLNRISSSKFKTSSFIIKVYRLYPHPILRLHFSPVEYIQSLGTKLSPLRGYWLKVILALSIDLVLRTLIRLLTNILWSVSLQL
jgi:hypothetical protein